jgi:hypothetical protein
MNRLNESACDQSDASKVMQLRRQILAKVVAGSLQVDANIAQIDKEITQSNEIGGYLSDKRDKTVNRANLLSIVSAGTLGATSTGSRCLWERTKLSSIVGIAAGLVSSSLAISGIRAQKGGTRLLRTKKNCAPCRHAIGTRLAQQADRVLKRCVLALIVVLRVQVFDLRFCEIELGFGQLHNTGKSQIKAAMC